MQSLTRNRNVCVSRCLQFSRRPSLALFRSWNVCTRRTAPYSTSGRMFSTTLMVSVEMGHLAASEFLVKHGAELDCQDGYGRTALSYAVHKGHREIIQLLLGCGARPFLPNAFFVFNPGCLLRLLEVSVLCLEPDHPSEISSPNPDRKLKRSPKGHTS